MDSQNLVEIFAEELDTLKSILLEGELVNEGDLSYTLVLRPNTGCDTEKVTVTMKMDLSFPENVRTIFLTRLTILVSLHTSWTYISRYPRPGRFRAIEHHKVGTRKG